jgi:hypothetical protein
MLIRSAACHPGAALGAFFEPVDEDLKNDISAGMSPEKVEKFLSCVALYREMFDKHYRPPLNQLRNLYNHYGKEFAELRTLGARKILESMRTVKMWQHYYDCVSSCLLANNPSQGVIDLQIFELPDNPKAHNNRVRTKMALDVMRYELRLVCKPFTFVYKGVDKYVELRHLNMKLKDAAADLEVTSCKLSLAWSAHCERQFRKVYRWPGTYTSDDESTFNDNTSA